MDILKWFGARKRELSLTEVKREEIKLGIREKQTISKLERLEKEKEDIFSKGAKIKSPSRRRQLARLFDMKSQGVKMLEHELSVLSKELTTLAALKLALERRQMSHEGTSHLLNRVNEVELMTVLEDDKISQEMYAEKLGEVMGILDEGIKTQIESLGHEGDEVVKVWQKLDDGEIEDVQEAIKLADQAVREKDKKTAEMETE
ncbi:MAG: hypothetical protein HYY16_07880 [Planctomycetes bacterium]|nr:hypothetical protein [Planctomycetota bacterium]